MTTKFTASAPEAQVIGSTVLSYLNCIEQESIAPILARYVEGDVQPDVWYPHQTLLNVLRDIDKGDSNVSSSMVSIGVQIMDEGELPPTIRTIPDILNALGVVYHMYHRNVAEPGWTAVPMGEHKIRLIHDSPYPNDLAYGIVWSSVRRFVPAGWQFRVLQSEPEHPNDAVYFDVEWGPA
ncbi:MAG: hypothetical protein U0670_02400 [Anaerolineae bacterium]